MTTLPRRRGLRIIQNTAGGISHSLRRSSSPKHNHFVGLCLGPRCGPPPLAQGRLFRAAGRGIIPSPPPVCGLVPPPPWGEAKMRRHGRGDGCSEMMEKAPFQGSPRGELSAKPTERGSRPRARARPPYTGEAFFARRDGGSSPLRPDIHPATSPVGGG